MTSAGIGREKKSLSERARLGPNVLESEGRGKMHTGGQKGGKRTIPQSATKRGPIFLANLLSQEIPLTAHLHIPVFIHPFLPMLVSGGGDGPPLYQRARSLGADFASAGLGSTHWHLVKDSHRAGRKGRCLSAW